MSAKKILVIPSWYPTKNNNYSGIFIKNQVEALHYLGACVSVFYSHLQFDIKYAFQKPTLRKELVEPVPTFIVEGFTLPKKTKYLLDVWVKKNLLLFETYIYEEGLPDIMHAHSFIAGYLAMKISEKYSIPFVLTEHYSGFLIGNIDKREAKIIRTVYAKSQKLIAVSTALKSKMERYTLNQVEVIGNMYVDSLFKFKEHVKRELFTFVTVGGLDDVKGYSILIDAFCLLLKNIQDVKLVIIGGGTNYDKLSRQIKKLGIESNVALLGPKSHSDIPSELDSCHSYVSSSDVETFGISLIEALAVGLPIVSTDSLGPMDYLDCSNSIISKDNSVEGLYVAMSQMILNYKTFNYKWIAAKIYSRYSTSVVCREILAMY